MGQDRHLTRRDGKGVNQPVFPNTGTKNRGGQIRTDDRLLAKRVYPPVTRYTTYTWVYHPKYSN